VGDVVSYLSDTSKFGVEVLERPQQPLELHESVIVVRWFDRARWRLLPAREIRVDRRESLHVLGRRIASATGRICEALVRMSVTGRPNMSTLDMTALWTAFVSSQAPFSGAKDGQRIMVQDTSDAQRVLTQQQRAVLRPSFSVSRSAGGSASSASSSFSSSSSSSSSSARKALSRFGTGGGSSGSGYREEGVQILTWKEREARRKAARGDGEGDGAATAAAAASPSRTGDDTEHELPDAVLAQVLGELHSGADATPTTSRDRAREEEVRELRDLERAQREAMEDGVEEAVETEEPPDLFGNADDDDDK
jgi:hypothetical protein